MKNRQFNILRTVVDLQNVKAKSETREELEKKCNDEAEIGPKVEKMYLSGEEDKLGLPSSMQNGMTEKESEGCSTCEGGKAVPTRSPNMDHESSPESIAFARKAKELKKNLSRIRWEEYSPYAKSLIKSNQWESIQHELITVVTYNVLSQILLERHGYLYEKHDRRSLRWETRSRILLEEFSLFNADILCLQEIEGSLVNSFYNKNLSQMGYQGIYKKRTNDKVDGCAIYFKTDKFELVKHSTVEFFKEAVNLLDRDNIGIILELSLKSNPEVKLIVATTHLLYNPRRGDIKLAQTQLMLAEIEKLAYTRHNPVTQRPEYLPILFTGDMNYSPDNGVYQLVTKSFLAYEGMSSEKLVPVNRGRTLDKTLLPPGVGVTDSCQYASSLLDREGFKALSFSSGALGHHLNLESVYGHFKGNLPEATTNQDAWVTVDYIFYSQFWNDDLKVRTEGNLKLISRLSLPNTQEAEVYLKYLPNVACASDHLPLLATFHLTGP